MILIQGGLVAPQTAPAPAAPPGRLASGLVAGAIAAVGLLLVSSLLGGSPFERLLAAWFPPQIPRTVGATTPLDAAVSAGGLLLALPWRSLAWLAQILLGSAMGALFAFTVRENGRWASEPWRVAWALAFSVVAWTPLQSLAVLQGVRPPGFGVPSLLTWLPCLAYGVILGLVHARLVRSWPGPSRKRLAPRLQALPGESGLRRPWRQGGWSPPARPRLV